MMCYYLNVHFQGQGVNNHYPATRNHTVTLHACPILDNQVSTVVRFFLRDSVLCVAAILKRHSVKTGQVLVQSVATCLFLCMDSCGLLYGSVRCFAVP